MLLIFLVCGKNEAVMCWLICKVPGNRIEDMNAR